MFLWYESEKSAFLALRTSGLATVLLLSGDVQLFVDGDMWCSPSVSVDCLTSVSMLNSEPSFSTEGGDKSLCLACSLPKKCVG